MSRLRLFAVLLLTTLLTGCLNSGTLIRLNPDGSGTIEQTLLVNMQALDAMMAGMGATKTEKPGGVLNEADLRRQAERMGGVRFVSAEPIKSGGLEGVKAIYAFDDINTVQVSEDPQMSGTTTGAFSSPAQPSNPVTFQLTRGATSVLTVRFADPRASNEGDIETGETPEMPDELAGPMMAMMKTMLQGFRVGIDLEVAGKVIRTNADHVQGSRVTLLEVDFGKLLQDEAKLTSLQKHMGPGASLSQVKDQLKGVEGIKINDPVVTIEFR